MDDNGWLVTSWMYIEMFVSTVYRWLHRHHYAVKFLVAVVLLSVCYARVQQIGATNKVLLGIIALGALVYAADIGIRHLFAWLNQLRSFNR